MAFYNNRSLLLERNVKRGTQRPLGPVGQRLAGALRRTDDEPPTLTEQLPQRFPVVRRGYDPAAVDAYVSELEGELAVLDRELAELRGGGAAAHQVEEEIKRIGAQTSAVLMAAHDQREQVLREARAEADRCVAEARASASALTAQCQNRLRQLQAQTEAAQGERSRLLEELRTISSALAAVVDSAEKAASG